MVFEKYEDVIDAFERDNMGYETLTDYIKGENIRIMEIEMTPLDDLKKTFSGADGGSVGIEVLFKEKRADGGRVGLFMGGPALEGTALNIYNSMSAYGFSDQEIADALKARGLYTPGDTTEDTGIISTAPNIINQGGGGDGLPPGPTFNRNDLLGTSDYQGTGPGFIESILGIPGALVNAYSKISPGINFVKNIFKPNVTKFYKGPTLDAIAKEKERQEIERQLAFEQAARDRETYRDLEDRITRGEGRGDDKGPSTGATAAGAGMGVGGGYASDYGFLKDGGLATMFKRKR